MSDVYEPPAPPGSQFTPPSRTASWEFSPPATTPGAKPPRTFNAVPERAGLADVADTVAAEIEGGEPRLEHRGKHRHVHQFVDRPVGAVRDQVLGLTDRFVPIGGF